MSIGHIIGLLKGSTSFPILAITMNPADKAASIVLSNGNMTVRRLGGTGWLSVRATQPRMLGKYYFEVVFDNFTAAFGCAGLMTASANLNNYTGQDANGIGFVTDGSWFTGAVATFGSLPTSWANGDVLCIAVDMDNRKIWARKNGGTWNAVSGGSNDPATNVGGITLPTNLQGALLYPAISVQTTTNDQSTARFTLSSFGFTVPSGFQAWESDGQLFVTQQRAYAIIGSAPGVVVNQQRAYGIVGSLENGIAVRQHLAQVISGMVPAGTISVNSERAYVVVGKPPSGNISVHSQFAYVVLTP